MNQELDRIKWNQEISGDIQSYYQSYMTLWKKHINSLLQDILAFSSATDIWTVSPISLTAQWIDVDFTPKRMVLQAKQFQGSHTSQAKAGAFEDVLWMWGIP